MTDTKVVDLKAAMDHGLSEKEYEKILPIVSSLTYSNLHSSATCVRCVVGFFGVRSVCRHRLLLAAWVSA